MDHCLFPESWKRFDHAFFHLKAFQTEWERVADPKAYKTSIETNSEWTKAWVRCVRNPRSENNLAVELGEFFYQLRATLDSLIYQCAIFLENADPPSNENRLEFPICEKPRWFKKSAVNAAPFPGDLRDWIESIQPYKASETKDTGLREMICVLKTIHDCARIDRHRKLHIVGAYPTYGKYEFTINPPTVQISNIRAVRVNFLESDDPFLFFDINGVRLNDNHVKLKSELVLEVSVNQIPLPLGSRLDEEVKRMGAAVETVIRYFEAGFKV